MADFGTIIYNPATGLPVVQIDESTIKDMGTYVATTNGTINAAALPITSTSTVMVEQAIAPVAPPRVTLDTATKQIAVSGGIDFSARIRVVDLL